MKSPRRKRKGIYPNPASYAGSHLSAGTDCARRSKRNCRGGHDQYGSRGVGVMTAPPTGCASAAGSSPGRGLKRKLGCIEVATRLGRWRRLEKEYVLGRTLGRGRYGSVRECRARAGGGEELACKTLPRPAGGDGGAHLEVEIMQHLSGHPGVVTLRAVFEEGDCFHLVMELCSGGRLLDEMVREGRFSEQRAANVMREVVSVIKYCHEMGVVHRDIKPENILLTASGKLKLADFGLAVRVTNGQKLSGIAGSPAYVAPEVLAGDYSEKVDIWGAGVLLHALLVGILPFQGNTLEDIFEAIKNVELDFQSGPWESISQLARGLVSGMLTRDVSTRMNAKEVLRHPWILFYTESPSKALSVKFTARSIVTGSRVQLEHSSRENSRQKSDEQDECGLVDVLAAALSRVRISEPKRSRICSPASPIQQECSSNMKAKLCAAF